MVSFRLPPLTLRCVIARAMRQNARMEIQLNGQRRIVDAGSSLSDLLHAEGLAERRVAIEVNGEIVPRGLHASQRLQAGDQIEIVHALGGG
jgi:sulfur carrier protein